MKKTSIKTSFSTQPIYQFPQKLQKLMFFNNVSISQQNQQIHEIECF